LAKASQIHYFEDSEFFYIWIVTNRIMIIITSKKAMIPKVEINDSIPPTIKIIATRINKAIRINFSNGLM